MARLFSKEYSLNSNTWSFRSKIIRLEQNDLIYWKSIDQHGLYNLTFFGENNVKQLFPVIVKIKYDFQKGEIVEHHCSSDLEDTCKHYLTVLDYAYKYISTDELLNEIVETYYSQDVRYSMDNQVLHNKCYLTISDLFNPTENKIHINFVGYNRFDLKHIAALKAGKLSKKLTAKEVKKVVDSLTNFTSEELNLLAALGAVKCSYSAKNQYFAVYKKDLDRIIPAIIVLADIVFIHETGDKLIWNKDPVMMKFMISKHEDNRYLLTSEFEEDISAIYYFDTIYVFIRNEVHKLLLPLRNDVIQEIIDGGKELSIKDVIYYHAIISKQLVQAGYYVDIKSDVEIPLVYSNRPEVTFYLFKENDAIIMDGKLDYTEDICIPLSLIRLRSDLVNYEYELGKKAWFFIPQKINNDFIEFLKKIPAPQYAKLEEASQLVFKGDKKIQSLKKAIFELSNENWHIELSDELKNDFVYRVHLQAEIKTMNKGDINWFEYNVVYKYRDFSFTHRELKKFFESKQDYMTLDDGRIIFFDNKEAFDQMETILEKSEETKEKIYSMNYEQIPYFLMVVRDNPSIKLMGDKYLENMSRDLANGAIKNDKSVPKFIGHIMRSYQKSGYRWLKMLAHYRLNGILADEMGLGKTIQAISILADVPENQKCMVVCPKTLIYNWAEEFKKFKLNKSFIIYEGSKDDRMHILEHVKFDIMIASYSIIQNDIEELKNEEFFYVILDEAQHIKNVTALRTKAIKKLNSRHKLALTGTPLENDVSEIWSIFDFLLPNYLMNKQEFSRAYNTEGNKQQREDLNKMISPFILRRKKIDVLVDLPEKQEQIAFCKLTNVQEKVYMQLIDKVKKSYFNPDTTEKFSYVNILTALMRLRQICDHPHLVEDSIKDDVIFSGKMELLQELILDAIASNRKILVFSQFIQMLHLVKNLLKEHDITYEYLDGKTDDRQAHIENFNNNAKVRVFLISLKAGGCGLNLTSADTVILTDPWWNPMIEDQAIDRAHRIGQTKRVQVYKLISKGTVEEKIIALQNSKRELFNQIVDNNDNILKSMTIEQIQELFNYSNHKEK